MDKTSGLTSVDWDGIFLHGKILTGHEVLVSLVTGLFCVTGPPFSEWRMTLWE
jgi:hypothetical protein